MKSRDELDRFHDYDINLSSRTIWLGGDSEGEDEGYITFRTAEKIIKNLVFLEEINKDPITILMNTPGGDVDAGFAIYDAIDKSNCHITIRSYRAESMGSIILQAADHRVMTPKSKLMIHIGSLGFSENHAKIVYKWIEQTKKDDRAAEQILLKKIKEKKPKFTSKMLKEMLEYDTYLTPRQAITYNLIDEIYGE